MDRTVCRSGHARDRKPSVATILIATHIPVAGMARSYKSGVQPGNLMHSRNNGFGIGMGICSHRREYRNTRLRHPHGCLFQHLLDPCL